MKTISLLGGMSWESTTHYYRMLNQGIFLPICINTMHKVAQIVTETVNIPLLHIADATARAFYKTINC